MKEIKNQAEDKKREEFPDFILEFIQQCMKEENPHSQLISVLHKVQDHFGYLSKERLEEVSQLMQIPAAKVSGVASFYHYFRLKPSGRWTISVCTGTACHVKGADVLLKKLQDELGIELGETTKDGLFTLDATRCLGTCALAPIIKIEDEIYSQVTPDQVSVILEKYFALARKDQ